MPLNLRRCHSYIFSLLLCKHVAMVMEVAYMTSTPPADLDCTYFIRGNLTVSDLLEVFLSHK